MRNSGLSASDQPFESFSSEKQQGAYRQESADAGVV
jgi:hypothetical protein